MKPILQAFMKIPTTGVGIATAILFQLIFAVVWMTGYHGITDRLDHLSVAIVNEDQTFGEQIVQGLNGKLPVHVETGLTMEQAQQQLQDRHIQMIVQIPTDFGKMVTSANPAQLHYLVNESNPVMIKNMMTSIADRITANVNRAAIQSGLQGVLGANGQASAQQAQGMAAALSQRVVSNIESVNPVQGMNNQMVPMMMILASYVGAMIMGQNFEISSRALASRFGRWPRMTVRLLVTTAAAVIVSLVGTSLVALLGGQLGHGFFALWGFQALFLLTFMFVAQMFLFVLGMPGMLFNILILSVQLVSSGAMMPRELLPAFYQWLGHLFPATYAVQGLMNILFGGSGTGMDCVALVLILLVALIIIAIATALRQNRIPAPAPVVITES
ncbi:YhgE/Pip domain-containing protein [Paenibacillus sp. SGZ-1009]|uniref:YhgE/Pip domain-containing protein n=1 Tax=Paenibacillus campi TaxID=3106031 RepID=UPI002AFF693A|nr:ABC transporter permease [Paenibacillus sp. SGZ-1009]